MCPFTECRVRLTENWDTTLLAALTRSVMLKLHGPSHRSKVEDTVRLGSSLLGASLFGGSNEVAGENPVRCGGSRCLWFGFSGIAILICRANVTTCPWSRPIKDVVPGRSYAR